MHATCENRVYIKNYKVNGPVGRSRKEREKMNKKNAILVYLKKINYNERVNVEKILNWTKVSQYLTKKNRLQIRLLLPSLSLSLISAISVSLSEIASNAFN